MIKLRIPRWGDSPALSGLALNAIASILTRRRQRESWHVYSGEGDEMKVLEVGVLGPQPKECGSQQKLEKARNTFAPGASRRSMARPAP